VLKERIEQQLSKSCLYWSTFHELIHATVIHSFLIRMAHLLEPFLRVQYGNTAYAHAYTMKHTVGVWRGLVVGQMEPRNLFNRNFVDSYLWNLSSTKLRCYTVLKWTASYPPQSAILRLESVMYLTVYMYVAYLQHEAFSFMVWLPAMSLRKGGTMVLVQPQDESQQGCVWAQL